MENLASLGIMNSNNSCNIIYKKQQRMIDELRSDLQ